MENNRTTIKLVIKLIIMIVVIVILNFKNTSIEINTEESIETTVESSEETVENVVDTEYLLDNETFSIKVTKPGLVEIHYKKDDYGVVMIQNKTKVGSKQYKYVMMDEIEQIALTEGAGTYNIILYNVALKDNGVTLIKETYDNIEVELSRQDENIVFTYNTTLVNFEDNTEVIDEVFAETDDIDEIYAYFCNMEYNTELSNKISSGEITEYRVDVSKTIEEKIGICYDLASSMVAVLRYKGYETKLVYGYANSNYHSWVSVHINNEWIDYDPTLKRTSYIDNMDYYEIDEYH
jgi:hypothetical protein